MPMLFALGQHSALVAISERLQGELLFAFHDNLYIKSFPNRAVDCSHILRQELWRHCRTSLNNGKTRLWNRAGLFPQGCEVLEDVARRDDPEAVVWKGNPELPLSQQGIKILVEHELESKARSHAELLEKIPRVKDLQCAWLILLYCGVSRANFFIRAVSPDHCSLQFAQKHEEQIWRCLTTLIGVAPKEISESARSAATLPLSSGGLGCRSTVRLRHAACWASWADSIKMIGERHPEVAATILRAMDENSVSHSIEAINICTSRLEEAGFVAPSWVQLVSGEVQAPDVVDEEDPNQPRKGWQATVSRVVETQFWDGLLPTLSNRDATLLRSQGALSSIPFIVFPTDRSCRIDPQPFRILLLRRLRPPAPVNCAFVRVWPSSRQLGPPPLGMLSCWDPRAHGISSGDCSGPHLSRSRWTGADKHFPS